MPFKHQSATALRQVKRGYIIQASVATYLTRFTIVIFFLRFAQWEKKKKFIPTSYVQGQPFPCPQPRIPFFWFTSSGFCKQPALFEVLAPVSLFLRGSHMQREYWKRTTLRSKSSTSKGLLCAPDPDNREKGMLSDQPQLLHISSTALLWGTYFLKDMMSLGTDFETHAIWQGYVEDPAAMDFIVRKARTIPLRKVQGTQALSKARGSCHKTSNNQPYSRAWKSLGDSIPELYCVAWLGLGHARKYQFKDFGEKERYESMDVCTRNLRQKAEKGKLTGSEATTRFPRASCFEKPTHSVPETWGRMYDVIAWSAHDKKKGREIGFPCS
jgi:hypothetical protein